MLAVDIAKRMVSDNSTELEHKSVLLGEGCGYSLAQDIHASIDFPGFAQSAMDGYGVHLTDTSPERSFTLIGEQQAGSLQDAASPAKGEAVRIFTGAKIPDGVNAVIQQEWVSNKGNELFVGDFPLRPGMNIRPVGSQTKQGERVLPKGAAITPGAAALLAGLGFDKINVIRKPRVHILCTGKELVQPGSKPQGSQIFESNSFALRQALQAMQIDAHLIRTVDDDREALLQSVEKSLQTCDVLLITGGVSVGDYDFVADTLHRLGVDKIFHGVAQKPGKPLYFGKKQHVVVFGLPGNPASVLTCFYQYVYPCLRQRMGFKKTALPTLQLRCLTPYDKKPGLTHFLKGKIVEKGVEILPHQESYKMNTYALADALIEITEADHAIRYGDLVCVYLLT